MTERKKSKSPYQKYGKTPHRYSELTGIAFQRMLVRTFGANYWVKLTPEGRPLLDKYGNVERMFPADAYRAA